MIRLGVIGAGGYGRIQIDGFLTLQAEGLLKIIALADPSAAVLNALVELPELKKALRFQDYRDLLAVQELDAVAICAPIPLHEEMTRAALERDLFILLEKPPVPLLSQLERLIAADTNGRIMVAFQHIYSASIRKLKQELAAGSIGRLKSISAQGLWPRSTSYYQRAVWAGQLTWEGQPVLDGPCTNAFAHFVNLVFYLAGDTPDGFAMPVQIAGETYRARPGLPTYDTGCLTGSLENDVRFFMGFSHAAADLSPVEIHIQGAEGKRCISENSQALPSEDLQVIPWDEGRESLRRAFIAFARGDASQNKTPLRAMKPYLLATNLMLLSSGGIHSIPGEYVRSIRTDAEDDIFAVDKMAGFLAQAARQFVPLEQASAPWAKKPRVLSVSDFCEDDLIETLQLAAEVEG